MDDQNPGNDDPVIVRLVTIISLAILVFTSIVSITFVAIFTDRDVRTAEGLTFGGAVLLACIGGFSWYSLRKKRKRRLHIDLGNGQENDS